MPTSPSRRGTPQERESRARCWTKACACPCCRGYSRAYLHHVVRTREMVAGMLLTWHNLHYYGEIMAGMRAAIAGSTFAAWEAAFHAGRAEGDLPPL